jgi:hypothetical protein
MQFMLMMKGDPPVETPAADGLDRPANDAFVAEIVRAMRAYSGELRKAGVLLAEGGLYPSWTAKGIHFASGAAPRVIDGPFTESKEVIAGYYLIEVSSEAEAIEWAKRCPIDKALVGDMETIFEIRRVADVPDTLTHEEAVEVVQGTFER